MAENDQQPFAPPETTDEPAAQNGDFVFRFPLQNPERELAGYDDPLLELIRGQLADLLDAVVLTDHGRQVKVDGFRLIQDPDTQYEIFPRPQDDAQP